MNETIEKLNTYIHIMRLEGRQHDAIFYKRMRSRYKKIKKRVLILNKEIRQLAICA